MDISDFIRSAVFFRYYQIKSLLTIMSQEKAIEFYKDFLDHLTRQRRDPKKYFDNINERLKERKQFCEMWQAHDLIIGKLDDNSMIYKITRCRWAEIMKELDSELNYTVACHGDFESVKNVNPNFFLTRTKTLMQGAEYCDFCISDTRFKKEIKHPSIEFWDKICEE